LRSQIFCASPFFELWQDRSAHLWLIEITIAAYFIAIAVPGMQPWHGMGPLGSEFDGLTLSIPAPEVIKQLKYLGILAQGNPWVEGEVEECLTAISPTGA
jgi:hypothetical protein